MEIQKPFVILDIGGIGIRLNYGRDDDSFFARASRIAGVEQDDFKSWYSHLEKRCLLGEVNARTHYTALKDELNSPNMSQEELESLVGRLWTGQIDKTVELKEQLHENGYQVGILSNMTDFALDILSRKHPQVFETWGGKKVYSFEHGVIKPDLAIYRLFDDIPGPKLFIDDNFTYAFTPASQLGWYAINYIEHVDSQEGIRNVQTPTIPSGLEHPVDGFFIAKDHDELLWALGECGVKL